MIPKIIITKLLPLVLKEVIGIVKPLQDYVYKPNDADGRIDKVEIDVFQLRERTKELEKKTHSPKSLSNVRKEFKELRLRIESIESYIDNKEK
mgnify:CR=1 FL=1